jgi:hypothetical protein
VRRFFSFLLAAAAAACWAQSDIPVSGISAYVDLGRNLAWGASGPGTANNAFIFAPISPNSNLCLFAQNLNTTSAHTFTLTVAQTGDQRQTAYAGQTAVWTPVSVNPALTTVAAGAVAVTFARTSGAARIAVVVSGSTTAAGTPDTLNLFAVQTTDVACGPVVGTGSTSGSPLSTSCGPSATSLPIVLSAAGNTQIIAPSAGKVTFVCKILLATATAEDVRLTRGTGTNCGTGTVNVSGIMPSILTLAFDADGTLVLPSGQALCVNQSAAQAAGGIVTYAQL